MKITAIGTTASNALATAGATSIAARSVASRPAGDASKFNASYRALEPFQRAGSATTASILEADAMTALNAALATRSA